MGSELDTLVGVEDMASVVASEDVQPLSDLHNIEAVIFAIHDLEDEIKSLQKLKKKRIEAINVTMEKVGSRIDFLKSVIFETLAHFKEKKVRFPGVGMVSQRKPRVSYEILDQDALFKHLKKENEFVNIVDLKTVPEVRKTLLNQLLAMWSRIDKLPSCVKEKKSETSVTVKFDDEPKEIENEDAIQDLEF